MDMQHALDYFDKEEIFDTAKCAHPFDQCLDEVDRTVAHLIPSFKKTMDHDLEDSIRDHPDLLNEIKKLWIKLWNEEPA